MVSALAFASPAQALGLTFNWSFNATSKDGTATAFGLVSGTISGLQDNATNTSGVTATVLVTPDAQYQGVTFNVIGYGGIAVANGVVTDYSVIFAGSNLASSDRLYFGNGVPHAPEYYIDSTKDSTRYDLYTTTGGVTFSAATPVPFDFDPSFGVVALGVIWKGRKAIQKIKASKQSV